MTALQPSLSTVLQRRRQRPPRNMSGRSLLALLHRSPTPISHDGSTLPIFRIFHPHHRLPRSSNSSGTLRVATCPLHRCRKSRPTLLPMLRTLSCAAPRKVGQGWTMRQRQRPCASWMDSPQRQPEPELVLEALVVLAVPAVLVHRLAKRGLNGKASREGRAVVEGVVMARTTHSVN